MLIDGWAGLNAATQEFGGWSKGGPFGAIQKYDSAVEAQNSEKDQQDSDKNTKGRGGDTSWG